MPRFPSWALTARLAGLTGKSACVVVVMTLATGQSADAKPLRNGSQRSSGTGVSTTPTGLYGDSSSAVLTFTAASSAAFASLLATESRWPTGRGVRFIRVDDVHVVGRGCENRSRSVTAADCVTWIQGG